jgi:hypothetical protein
MFPLPCAQLAKPRGEVVTPHTHQVTPGPLAFLVEHQDREPGFACPRFRLPHPMGEPRRERSPRLALDTEPSRPRVTGRAAAVAHPLRAQRFRGASFVLLP